MFKPFDLTGKVALVTGGNGGIGLGMAQGLAAAGADVVIWGTNAGKNEAAVGALQVHGTRIVSRKVNVAQESEVNDGIGAALAELGRLDCVIANAGIVGDMGAFQEMSLESFRKVQSINEEGVFFTLRAASKHMVARAKKGDAGGSLVAVASISAIHGAGRVVPYGASKGAVLSMVRGIAVELARYGIRANSVAPGWTISGLTEEARQDPTYTEKVISRVPMRRWGDPEDFSGIAVYLASDASKFHTGDTIVVDGGYVAF